MKILKKIAGMLPNYWQNEMKRYMYKRQIYKNMFVTSEGEFRLLDTMISPGDWVIDVGANVGHYTKRFSELVGVRGRVIAFEPVPATFALLAANVQLFAHSNVSLINAAASQTTDSAFMSIPTYDCGLKNYYQAQLSPDLGNISVMTMDIDSFDFKNRISLVKIDAEGHEEFVLQGMQKLILRHHPVLLIETYSQVVEQQLLQIGYSSERLDKSPNVIYRFK